MATRKPTTGPVTCECSGPGCPVHKGYSECFHRAQVTVFRTDMDDQTGTLMCADCATDALNSGVFTPEEESE